MEKPLAINPILRRLDAIGAARTPPLTRYAIAKLAGVDESTIRKLENRPSGHLTGRTISKLVSALHIRPEDILGDAAPEKGMPAAAAVELPPVPLLGLAAGAATASFIIEADPIDYIDRPPALRHVRNAYAVYVENDSMAPMHPRGELRFIDPNRPTRAGDTVIVQTRDERGDRQAWIKILEKRTDAWLVCRQINPAAEVRYARSTVVATHRVLTTAELFNR